MTLVFRFFVLFIFIFFETTSFCQATSNKTKETIKIGLLVQENKSTEAKNAAEIAVNKVNAQGGINGRPIKLITRSMEGPWGTGSKQAVDLIFNKKVWAIIGSHDGRNAHLVEQACAKTQSIFLSAWSGDPTLSQAFVPWYFSCVPNDRQQAEALIKEIYNKRKISKIVLVADKGYDSELASKIFVKTAKKLNKTVPLQLFYKDPSNDFNDLVSKIKKANVGAIVLLGQPKASAKILQTLKQHKLKQPVFGNLLLLGEINGRKPDLKKYENLVLISSENRKLAKWRAFKKEYQQKTGKIPGSVAAYAYDGTNVIIDAIKKSKLDKNKLRNTLLNMQFSGITGLFKFDSKGNRTGKIDLMKIKNGFPVVLP